MKCQQFSKVVIRLFLFVYNAEYKEPLYLLCQWTSNSMLNQLMFY